MKALNNINKKIFWIVGIIIVFVTSVFAACALGSVYVPIEKVINVIEFKLFNVKESLVDTSDIYIIWNLRIPRALLGFAVGGGLAVCGAAMQSITKNVMADPYVLGISSGALAFVSIGFLIGGSLCLTSWFIPLLAFMGAIFSLALVFMIGGFASTSSPVKLVLSGMAVSITLNAVAQYCIYKQENSGGAKSIVNWTLGSLGGARWDNIGIPFVGCTVGIIFFVYEARAFDLIALGDETATILGTNTSVIKKVALLFVAIICGISVAACGLIGMVGFVIPHIVRFFVGTNHRKEFPLAFFTGGIFLIIMDILARTVMAPSEIPIGVFTALCGGPYFIWLIKKKSKR